MQFLAGDSPSYFIYGPLVFMPVYAEFANRLDAEYLAKMGSPITTRATDNVGFDGEELVVVPTRMFPHPIAKGYTLTYPAVVAAINGIQVRNLRHLATVLRDLEDEFVVFEWDDQVTDVMVFRHAEMIDTTEQILESNGIRAACSPDLRDLRIGQ